MGQAYLSFQATGAGIFRHGAFRNEVMLPDFGTKVTSKYQHLLFPIT
jgi:hypothetical protein